MSAFLIATDADDAPVGLCLCEPVISGLEMIEQLGVSEQVAGQLVTRMLLGVVKVTVLAVDPEHRGVGLGAVLLDRAVAMAGHRRAWYVYGQTRAADQLTGWYRSAGMTVLPAGHSLDLSPLFQFPIGITPEPTNHIFVKARGSLPVRSSAPDPASTFRRGY
jgi:GNAT superfamily N-acetyltransferase